MNADIICDPTFPHGTADGFRGGCHGSHCPAPVACRDVHTRYQGDYAFRKAIDAGVRAVDFIANEKQMEEEAAATALAEKRAKTRAAHQQRANEARKLARATKTITRIEPGVPRTDYQRQVVALVAEGLTDKQIAERVGKSRDQVCTTRNNLRLKPNLAPTTSDRIRELHAQGHDDLTIARMLGKRDEYINACRRRMGLPLIKATPTVVDSNELRRLHTAGYTDRQIAQRMHADARYVGKRRRRLGLNPNKTPATAGVHSSQEKE